MINWLIIVHRSRSNDFKLQNNNIFQRIHWSNCKPPWIPRWCRDGFSKHAWLGLLGLGPASPRLPLAVGGWPWRLARWLRPHHHWHRRGKRCAAARRDVSAAGAETARAGPARKGQTGRMVGISAKDQGGWVGHFQMMGHFKWEWIWDELMVFASILFMWLHSCKVSRWILFGTVDGCLERAGRCRIWGMPHSTRIECGVRQKTRGGLGFEALFFARGYGYHWNEPRNNRRFGLN